MFSRVSWTAATAAAQLGDSAMSVNVYQMHFERQNTIFICGSTHSFDSGGNLTFIFNPLNVTFLLDVGDKLAECHIIA